MTEQQRSELILHLGRLEAEISRNLDRANAVRRASRSDRNKMHIYAVENLLISMRRAMDQIFQELNETRPE